MTARCSSVAVAVSAASACPLPRGSPTGVSHGTTAHTRPGSSPTHSSVRPKTPLASTSSLPLGQPHLRKHDFPHHQMKQVLE